MIEEEFHKLCDSHLLIIINDVIKDYQKNVITRVSFEGYNLNVLIKCDDEQIKVSSNYKKMQTYVSSNKKEYVMIYDNHSHKISDVKEYLYQKNNKSLVKKNMINHDLDILEKEYSYSFYINDKCFDINLLDYHNNFDEETFLNYCLSKYILSINNIDEMYLLIVNSNDITGCKLEIIDKSNDDILLMCFKIILKYHLTYQDGDIKKEIFLKDNKFYEKETTIKELSEDKVYIKKIGGRYGKRKEN